MRAAFVDTTNRNAPPVQVKIAYHTGQRRWVREACHWCVGSENWAYKATDDVAPTPKRWRSPIHMPRWASRLTLIVTDVKIERVQDISRKDAIAEGLRLASAEIEDFWRWPEPLHERLYLSPVAAFRDLWDTINAKPRPRYTKIGGRRVVSHYESFPWGEPGELARIETYRGKPHQITPNPWGVAATFDVHRRNIDQMGEAA